MPRIPSILALAISLAAAATGAYAQAPAFARPDAAIAALFPQQTFVEWTSTTGESPRVLRRLNTLRGLSHEED